MLNQLPNGDSYSTLNVHPANWKSTKAPMGVWYITYRYYFVNGESKQVMIKGMNRFKDRVQRQQVTQSLLKEEEEKLKSQHKEGNMLFTDALELAMDKITVTHQTFLGMKHVVSRVKKSILNQKLNIPVNTVTRKHIRMVLDGCYQLSPKFSDRSFNHYRRYLSILFRYLLETEKVETNPVNAIIAKNIVHKMRDVLTLEQWLAIADSLKLTNYTFYRFLTIFMFSGARITELLLVKKEHVSLEQQLFTVTIRKGSYRREVSKVITNDVLPLWAELMVLPGEFLFSENLQPGTHPVRYEQIARRWKVHVKAKLSITADCYSLKHLYTDLLSQHLGLHAAAANAGHTSTSVTSKFYATGHEKRFQDSLKSFSIIKNV